jgi:hypothetical protein
MGSVFRRKVNVDIRDSVPDWEPFLQPKAPPGAPAGGTLTLFVDMEPAGSAAIMTQPGYFSLTGEYFVDHEKEVLAYLARD